MVGKPEVLARIGSAGITSGLRVIRPELRGSVNAGRQGRSYFLEPRFRGVLTIAGASSWGQFTSRCKGGRHGVQVPIMWLEMIA
jgi:hypothetical protein